MNIYTSHLQPKHFQAIKSDSKTIEARVYDEKRQAFHPGDQIVFINRSNTNETIAVTIIGLLRYPTFKAMFKDNDPVNFGGSSREELLKQSQKLYSAGEEQKYGVVGIELQLQS